MKLLKGVSALLLVSFTTSIAYADPPVAIPPGEDKITYVKKGEPAPYDGQLFDNLTALRWGNYLEQYKFRAELDEQTQAELSAARDQYFQVVIENNEKKYQEVTELQKKTILGLEKKLAEPDPWYESFEFGFGMGVLGATILGVLTAVTVGELTKD